MSESKDKPTISAPRGNWGSLLSAPRLLSTPSQHSSLSGTVLQPPQLKTNNNPFAKVIAKESVNDEKDVNKLPVTDEKKPSTDSNNDSQTQNADSSNKTIPKFLPLHPSTESISFTGGTNVPVTPAETISSSCNFVFGQNLQDRIVKCNEESNDKSDENHVNHPATNGSSELLFSAALKANNDGQTAFIKLQDESGTSNQNSTTWSWISEPPTPSMPPTGPIITGEEDEDNVIQIHCRLFAFEQGQWKERGRGQLRLNDSEHGSRLLCRSAGSLRILLNTKVWGEMTVDLASPKSLRVTATDAQQQVKVFLIMARPEEITRLSKCLQTRVAKAKLKDSSKPDTKDTDSASPKPILPLTTNQHHEANSSENSSLAKPQETNIETGIESDCIENHKNECAEFEGDDGNPVVIVSHESDDSLRAKRPLETDEKLNLSKKICTEHSVEDVPL